MKRLAVILGVALAVVSSSPRALAGGFEEEVISFTTHDGLVLEGIVSYPRSGAGPFPGMVLVHGSGLHDADLTIDIPDYRITHGEQRLFRDLARFFSRRGLAVLRYNKRGASFEHEDDEPQLLFGSTITDLVRDAESAYRSLASHPKVDADRMAMYGHSEGSMVVPRAARRLDGVKLVVLVGSVSSSLEDILHFQTVGIYRIFLELAADGNRDGLVTLEELDRLDGNFGLGSFWVGNLARGMFALQTHADGTVSVEGVNPASDADGDGRLHIANEILPGLERSFRVTVAAWASGVAAGAYGQSLYRARPTREIISRVRAPILFCQGELDFQTPVAETLDLMAVLESNGRTDYEALIFRRLGHSLSKPNDFIKTDGGLTILDNPTLNAMKKPTMRKILRKVRRHLGD